MKIVLPKRIEVEITAICKKVVSERRKVIVLLVCSLLTQLSIKLLRRHKCTHRNRPSSSTFQAYLHSAPQHAPAHVGYSYGCWLLLVSSFGVSFRRPQAVYPSYLSDSHDWPGSSNLTLDMDFLESTVVSFPRVSSAHSGWASRRSTATFPLRLFTLQCKLIFRAFHARSS